MKKRIYNIFFNTHTISGIIISVLLYVIFFAGSFSFFRDEIDVWQNGSKIDNYTISNIDYDSIINHINNKYQLHGRDLELQFKNHHYLVSNLRGTKDTLNNPKGKLGAYFFLDIKDLTTQTYSQKYGLSEFLYRLHFLDPIYYPIGRNLAGFVALFFVFAIVTGTIVHWKKIIPEFFTFNPKAMLKRLWTDAHTSLGVIGLPFQFMYGVTGAFFIIGVFALFPVSIVFKGDRAKMIEELRPSKIKESKWEQKADKLPIAVTPLLKNTKELWGDFHIKKISVSNFGGTNMKYIISGELDVKKRFVGVGRVSYDAYTGEKLSIVNPNELNYLEDFMVVLSRLHLANYGGLTLKIIYFLLGLLTCFVIITGVLIYVEARNKKSYTLKQRTYTANVGYLYLGICLAMFPTTALSFIFAKITDGMFQNPKMVFNCFYFLVWGIFVLFYRLKKDNYFTNKNSLFLGGVFGLIVPIVNGVMSGNWFWITYSNHQYEIFFIDVFWMLLSLIVLLIYFKIGPDPKKKKSSLSNNVVNLNISKNDKSNNLVKDISMKIKIVILWFSLSFGWVVHHLYGVLSVYYKQSLMFDGANGIVPLEHHAYRILFEGMCLLFAILTLELKQKGFVWISLVWSIFSGIFNLYHFVSSILHETTNYSELFLLLLMVIVSGLLVKNIDNWRRKLSF